MSQATEFESLRPLLFSIAHGILRSVADAEDAVQETWLRHTSSAVRPDSLRPYLSTVVTRISIDVLRSARVRRETAVGPWMPEVLLTETVSYPYDDPERAVELADSASMASLLLLERLTPLERAVFVLREVFGFDFDEIAASVKRSEPACRQLASRARRHMRHGSSRFEADRRQRDELADRFFDALRDGDVDRLRDLLTSDVATVNDSGGRAGGQGGSFGATRTSRILIATVPPLLAAGAVIERRELHGHPGAVLRDKDSNVVGVWTLEFIDGQVETIRSVTNPDRLRHFGPVGDLRAVIRQSNEARRSARL